MRRTDPHDRSFVVQAEHNRSVDTVSIVVDVEHMRTSAVDIASVAVPAPSGPRKPADRQGSHRICEQLAKACLAFP